MRYTQEQKIKALKKLARYYGEYNLIIKDDYKTRASRVVKMHKAVFSVIKKFGLCDDYSKAMKDLRRKSENK